MTDQPIIGTNCMITSFYPIVFNHAGKTLCVHYDGQITIDKAKVEDYEAIGFIRNMALDMTQEAVARDPAIARLIESHKLKPKGSIL